MDIKTALLQEHSKRQNQRIVDYVGNHPERFAELITLFWENEYRVTQRAAWTVSDCCQQHPELIMPYLPQFINNLRQADLHDAVKRNTLRVLQIIDIPEDLLGDAADVGFTLFGKKEEAIAIRVFAMTVLLQVVQKVPELKDELRYMIEEQMPYETPAFVSRGMKTLKVLGKIN